MGRLTTGLEQNLCSADDFLRVEVPRVTQIAENGLHVKGKMNAAQAASLDNHAFRFPLIMMTRKDCHR